MNPGKPADGAGCNAATECCSNVCSEVHKCNDVCKTVNQSGCSWHGDDCCVGLYCSLNSFERCRTCIPNGMSAEVISTILGDVVDNRSCCSNKIDGTGKCVP